MIANCGHDERGAYTNGSSGDQTGTEWEIRSWYSRPWSHVLRHPDRSVGDTIAECAIQGAQNDCIGYDQNQRYTFWDELKKAGYWPKNIKNKCETDCSASTAACVKATGYIRNIDALKNVNSDCYSGNIRKALSNAGFEVLTDLKYLESDQYLFNGDILLCENHHVAICVSDGSKVSRTKEETKMGVLTSLGLRKEVNRIYTDANARNWHYGDSKSMPPCYGDGLISCDRLIFAALYKWYKDQRPGGETVYTMTDWLCRHGFYKIHKESYLTHGDIILMKWNGTDQPHWKDHTFLLDVWNGKGQPIWKYDAGSYERLRAMQPLKNVRFNEWEGEKHFKCAFRVPNEDAGIKEGNYKIVSALGNQWVLDVASGSILRKANIQLYKDNGTPAQIFHIKPVGSGLYTIVNVKSGLSLDVANGSTEPGANIQQHKIQKNKDDQAAQRFFIQKLDGYMTISCYKSGQVFDVKNGKAEKRANIQQWSLNGNRGQKWKLVRVE